MTRGLELAGADGSIEASGPKEALRVDRVGGDPCISLWLSCRNRFSFGIMNISIDEPYPIMATYMDV